MDAPPWWRDPKYTVAAVTSLIVAVLGVVGAIIAATIANRSDGGASTAARATAPKRPLTIYSSLPKHDATGAVDKQTEDMEKAIWLALDQAGRKAGGHPIKYMPRDGTTETQTKANARLAADDEDTAVYIGDRSSSASALSMPILNKAGIPQISPASTRVALTVRDPTADTDEPAKYFPTKTRTFVRIIPNDVVQAAALMAVIREDGCEKLAMIDDGKLYSKGLSSNMRLLKRPSRAFHETVNGNAGAFVYTNLAQSAKRMRVDCFIYVGENNVNTFEVFRTFAKELPRARLYGTDALTELSFRDPGAGNLAATYARRVKVMIPPRDLDRYGNFLRAFAKKYHTSTTRIRMRSTAMRQWNWR